MPTRSRHPDFEIPNVDLWDLCLERPTKPFQSNKIIFHDTISPRRYTFDHIRGSAAGFGQALRKAWNWQKGDVLAIHSANDVDWPTIVFGCHWAGGVVTTSSPAYNADELAGQLQVSGAKAIATQPGQLKTVLQAAQKVGIPKDKIILMGLESKDAPAPHFTALPGYRFNQPNELGQRPFKVQPQNDLAFIIFSSGTTGKPKGVMVSHRNAAAGALAAEDPYKEHISCGDGTNGSGDRSLSFTPMFHIYGLMIALVCPLFFGIDVHVMPAYSLEAFVDLVQSRRITYAYVAPRVVLQLAKDPLVDKYDLSSLKVLISAASAISKDIVDQLYARIGVPVTQKMGSSEAVGGTHQNEMDEWDLGIGSVGRPAPNVVTKIVDIETLEELGPGEAGELWVKGPSMFTGYLNNPEATKETIRPDGWVRMGDIGYIDKDGLFWLTDRLKELIKFNGFQVAPAELEGLLTSHPKIKEAGVIGIWSKEQQTELPRAYIAVEDGVAKNETTAEEITKWVSERVAKHKYLRGGVKFVDAVPFSPTGKILRRDLKDLAAKEARGAKL